MQKGREIHPQEFPGATQSRELDGEVLLSPGLTRPDLIASERNEERVSSVNHGKGFVDFLT